MPHFGSGVQNGGHVDIMEYRGMAADVKLMDYSSGFVKQNYRLAPLICNTVD